jgi:hypothetical protein
MLLTVTALVSPGGGVTVLRPALESMREDLGPHLDHRDHPLYDLVQLLLRRALVRPLCSGGKGLDRQVAVLYFFFFHFKTLLLLFTLT